jgi:hypothetical protein
MTRTDGGSRTGQGPRWPSIRKTFWPGAQRATERDLEPVPGSKQGPNKGEQPGPPRAEGRTRPVPSSAWTGRRPPARHADRGVLMCQHQPARPPEDAPDTEAASVVDLRSGPDMSRPRGEIVADASLDDMSPGRAILPRRKLPGPDHRPLAQRPLRSPSPLTAALAARIIAGLERLSCQPRHRQEPGRGSRLRRAPGPGAARDRVQRLGFRG